MRMGIRCFEVVKSTAYIFVQQFVQSGYLEPLEFKEAEKRAAISEEFFKEILQIENVRICKDYSRTEIIAQLKEIEIDTIQFGKEYKNDTQAVNAVFICWFGFW